MDRFIAKYRELLTDNMAGFTQMLCEGCELDLGNQEGHQCIMFDYEDQFVYFERAFAELNHRILLEDLKKAMEEHMLSTSCNEAIPRQQQEEAERRSLFEMRRPG